MVKKLISQNHGFLIPEAFFFDAVQDQNKARLSPHGKINTKIYCTGSDSDGDNFLNGILCGSTVGVCDWRVLATHWHFDCCWAVLVPMTHSENPQALAGFSDTENP